MIKDSSKIPPGDYCYTWSELPSVENNYRGKINKCPYYEVKKVDGVIFPWCNFLGLGGYPGDGQWTGWENFEEAEVKLNEHFEGKADEKLPLSLLFDSCKECGENTEE
jgi:hypothetical protein